MFYLVCRTQLIHTLGKFVPGLMNYFNRLHTLVPVNKYTHVISYSSSLKAIKIFTIMSSLFQHFFNYAISFC